MSKVTVQGEHHALPLQEPQLCPDCWPYTDPTCQSCDGLGRIYPQVNYDEMTTILVNGARVRLADSLKLRNHSPTGFSWGYGGSGPAQTALGILFKLTGDPDEALRWYQQFKADVIVRIPTNSSFEFEFDFASWKWAHQHGGDPLTAVVFKQAASV